MGARACWLVLILSVGAWAAPQMETLELKVGERLNVAMPPEARVNVTDRSIVTTDPDDAGMLALQGVKPGSAVLTVQGGDDRRTYLVHVAPSTDAAPVAGRVFGPVRPQLGLDVRTQVDKPRALPDDVVTYTVLCRNLGPGVESKVLVEARMPDGLEMVPVGATPGTNYEPQLRRVTWQVPSLNADEQSAFSFRARVAGLAPGARLETAATVVSASMPHPRLGPAASTEVVTAPLFAAFALPDVVIARSSVNKALIDVDSLPGQRVVERLEGLGVVSGYPDGSFRPSASVTRAEATKMIVAVKQLADLRDKTRVILALSRPATVVVSVENSEGKGIRKLADHWALPQGQHQLVWDGLNDAGQPVPMGVYRYRVSAVDAEGLEQSFDGTIHVVAVRPLPTDLETSFIDVPKGAWYHPYVAKAEKDGIVRGYPGREFEPSAKITRVENTVMVVRAAGLSKDAEGQMAAKLGFTDTKDIPRWAVGYVAVATANGPTAEGKLLVAYSENRFLPQQNLSRAEAAQVLERLLDRDNEVEVTASGRVARGHQVLINGRPVTGGETGRFRQQVPIRSDLELVPVQVH